MVAMQALSCHFNLFPNWQWENLSPLYKSSPLLCLDEDIIGTLNMTTLSEGAQSSSNNNDNPRLVPDVVQQPTEGVISKNLSLPLPAKFHRSNASKCRELLAELKRVTFLLHDADAIYKLQNSLQEPLDKVQQHIPKEEGID